MTSTAQHATQSRARYEPPQSGIGRGWFLVITGLVVTAAISLTFKPVCRPDVPGMGEPRFGIRHEQRGTQWYHCEPWIRRVLTKDQAKETTSR